MCTRGDGTEAGRAIIRTETYRYETAGVFRGYHNLPNPILGGEETIGLCYLENVKGSNGDRLDGPCAVQLERLFRLLLARLISLSLRAREDRGVTYLIQISR